MSKLLRTPALLLGLAGEVIALLIAAGVHVSPDLHTAILSVLATALTILGVLYLPAVQAKLARLARTRQTRRQARDAA